MLSLPWMIVAAILIIGLSILIVYLYSSGGLKRKPKLNRDIWNDFITNLQTMNQRGKCIGLVVSSNKKMFSFAEKVNTLILPAFEYAIDNIHRSGAIRVLEINRDPNKMPPNCHVLAVFTLNIKHDQYVISATYYSTNAVGRRSSEALRYRPDTIKLSYAELSRFQRR
ncbi:MAG: hypothetical protein C4527_01900, partial [Candidatus Omnitrophota bacterium]